MAANHHTSLASHKYGAAATSGTWSTGLCSWCAEPGGCKLCLCSAFCTCCQYGITVEKLGPQATCGGSCCGAGWFYCLMVSLGVGCVPQLITRGEIRKMHSMQPGSGSDCLVAWCCPACGVCQEAREVDIRAGTAATKGGPAYTYAAPPQTQTMTQNY
ncbi:hypothetical protein ABBQ38_013857 [Trebouxia sp. C0009 RCD-2024]